MKFSIIKNKSEQKIIVNAFAEDVVNKDAANTEQIMKYLHSQKIKFGKCTKEDRVCNRNNKMSGQWVFEFLNINKEKQKSKKTLDKTPKSVVSSNGAKRTKKSS